MTDCPSRWLQEAWQRAQGQHALSDPEARVQNRAPRETRIPPKLPERAPLALRVSEGGRRALGMLLGSSVAGAALPWVGPGLAACALLVASGLVALLAAWWRHNAERSLSNESVWNEVKKLFLSKPLHEFAERLTSAACQSSPLLRCVQASARSADLAGGCLLAEHQIAADQASLAADVMEVRWHGIAAAAAAAISFAAMWVFQGWMPALGEGPRLLLAGSTGALILLGLASLLALRGERFHSELRRFLGSQWLPLLSKSLPASKTEFHSLEKSLHELTAEFQNLRQSLDRRRDAEFVDTLAELRSSVDLLTPVLAAFREPFVLQAVPMPPAIAQPQPMPPRKAMSATA
jgi:hypothetical protein